MSTSTDNASAVGYVDGFVIPVPKGNLERYREQATIASQVWREFGALDYLETVGEDLAIEFGKPFPELAGIGEDEVVVFAYISFRDRAHRDEVNARVMGDPRIQAMCPEKGAEQEPPFDPKRMTYGGFTTLVRG